MSKKNFVTLILSAIGGILFALGMCMTLLPEWNAWGPGVVTGCTGMVVLLVMLLIRRKMAGKPVWSSSPRKLWLSLCWAWRAR